MSKRDTPAIANASTEQIVPGHILDPPYLTQLTFGTWARDPVYPM